MSNNSSSASRVAAHNLKGVPYTGWIEGVGYQHLRNRPIVNCYFRDGGVSLPNFEPVIDTSPKMRVASVGGKYRVEQGENLSIIARRFGTTPDAIMAANPSIDWAVARKKGNLIYAGELLEIPPVFEEANAQNRPVPRAQVVDAKSFYGDKRRGGLKKDASRGSSKQFSCVDAVTGAAILDRTPRLGRAWSNGMPTTYHDGNYFLVVSQKSGSYVNILDSELKRDFDAKHRVKLGIPGNLYMSPVANHSFFGGIMSVFSSQANPFVDEIPYLSILRPDLSFRNTMRSMGSDLRKYEKRLIAKRFYWFQEYGLIY